MKLITSKLYCIYCTKHQIRSPENDLVYNSREEADEACEEMEEEARQHGLELKYTVVTLEQFFDEVYTEGIYEGEERSRKYRY